MWSVEPVVLYGGLGHRYRKCGAPQYKGAEDDHWEVFTDTLRGRGPAFADAYQYRLTLFSERQGVSPKVCSLSVIVSDSRRQGEDLEVAEGGLYGRELPVPVRFQMVYPDGGEAWCSPAALSMVMAYWASRTGEKRVGQPVPAVASRTYDYAYGGHGNWPFNTAYASSFGLRAWVYRFDSLSWVERWLACGVPVVASIAWGRGELAGVPIPESDGHLLVIRGFGPAGEVIVNDPAGREDSEVRRIYQCEEFARAWFRSGSGGVAYLVCPGGS